MTQRELINEFKYNGCDISKYKNKVEIVNTNEHKMITNNKEAIATTRTFACTNVLVFNNDFAYLAHLLPPEAIGLNDDFSQRIEALVRLLNCNVKNLNVLIVNGISTPKKGTPNFHSLEYLTSQLEILKKECHNKNIIFNLLPAMKSKYLLFDLKNFLLYVDNPKQEAIKVDEILNETKGKRKR